MSFLSDLIAALFRGRSRPAPKPIPPPEPDPGPAPSGEAGELANQINIARKGLGLPRLAIDNRLAAVAQRWATSMATKGVLAHGGAAGRIAAVFPGAASGECIAEGQRTAAEIVAAWMASTDGHREIVAGNYSLVGGGVARDAGGHPWWVADFVLAD